MTRFRAPAVLLILLASLGPAAAAPSPPTATTSAATKSAATPTARAPSLAKAPPPPDLPDLNDLHERWGWGVESVIESAYRACFRTFVLGGRIITLRIPFGENNDRAELAGGDLAILGGGKADPSLLWEGISGLVSSADFAAYTATLADGREKVIVFDLVTRRWEESRDLFLVARAKAGLYPGLPHRPVVLSEGGGLDEAAVYDYLWAVGGLGMDCSGFVWHSIGTVARAGGLDLVKALGRPFRGTNSATAPLYIGTWFFTPDNKAFELVDDRIDRLRPADILVFRDEKGKPVHSALIQSIDRKAGRIRYLQSTDEAPRDERGVHESYIEFDPTLPELRLGDARVRWLQKRVSAFEGEPASTFPDDGTRYRAWSDKGIYAGTGRGGGFVVRLRALAPALKKLASARAPGS